MDDVTSNESKRVECSSNKEEEIFKENKEECDNVSYINEKSGKLVINSKFPDIEIKLIKKYLPKDTSLIQINGPINNIDILEKIESKKAIIGIKYTIEDEEVIHFVFYDSEKIWDSWFKEVYFNKDLKDVYFKHYKPINGLKFEMLAPQQSWEEGVCTLFSLANARLRAKGEKLETMDKILQAQTMEKELSTLAEINSKMHVNGIQIFGL